MEKIVDELLRDLEEFLNKRPSVAEAIGDVKGWRDAIRILLFLDCLDAPVSAWRTASVCVQVRTAFQLQVFTDWLIMSTKLKVYLGHRQLGANSKVTTEAGNVFVDLLDTETNTSYLYRNNIDRSLGIPTAMVSRFDVGSGNEADLFVPSVFDVVFGYRSTSVA